MRFTALALSLILTIVESEQGLAQALEFWRLGNGACLDCNGNAYDFIRYHLTNSVSNVEYCKSRCTECANQVSDREFRGVWLIFLDSILQCNCVFDDIPGASFNGACGGFYYFTGASGAGEVCSSTNNDLTECWIATEIPSDSPSESPSESMKPSMRPSKVASMKPSMRPSDSDVPSTSPSKSPSDEPSSESSSEPSSEASSEPSATPSCVPSAYPTESPSTESGGPALWYPKWEQGAEGCFIDGQEPVYMVVNPGEWLSTTLQKCCQKHFSGYYYDQCLHQHPPALQGCNDLSLFYPDWHGSNERCLDDGEEPSYMLQNKEYFLSNSLLECCEKFYAWDVYSCTDTSPVLTNGEYFPDWEGGSEYCTNEGEIPLYMLNNQRYYMSPTLEDCCDKHFSWDKNDCMGGTMTGSSKWYVVYSSQSEETCLQDCVGAKPCGGLVPSWQDEDLFDTQEECCDTRLYWVDPRQCIENSRA